MIAFAKCALAEKNSKKAVVLGALFEVRMNTDRVKLMEPDIKALQEVLTQGKKKLGKAANEAAYKKGKSLKLENEIMNLITE